MSVDEQPVYTIDLAAMLNHVLVGVRRAHAFMAIGSKGTEMPLDSQLGVENGVFSLAWASPDLSSFAQAEAIEEFRAWLTAGALMELDKHLSTFCDQVWDIICLMNAGPMAQRDPSFSKDTNVRSKLSKIFEKIRYDSIYDDYFAGYSLARNALAHNHGFVREQDCNDRDAKTLTVIYRMPTIVVYTIPETTIDFFTAKSDDLVFHKDDKVAFRFAEKRIVFPLGSRINFDVPTIICICISYQTTAQEIINALERLVRSKDISDTPKPWHWSPGS